MDKKLVLTTTARLHNQVIQEVLSSREALEIVRDWVGEFMEGVGNIKSWTPYWKEILVRRPGNIMITFRFRLGGPLDISQSHGWTVTETEREELEKALLPLLDELGTAMTQRLVADGIQATHPEATRIVRSDDSIMMQMNMSPENPSEEESALPPDNVVIIIRPDLSVQFYVRCDDETVGRTLIRRLIADLQVAGLPLSTTETVIKPQ